MSRDDDQTVQLDDWDGGDILAVVSKPDEFHPPERARKRAAIDLAEVVTDFAAPAVPGLWPVQLVVLGLKLSQNTPAARSAHVALIAAEDARRLAGEGLLSFPNGGPVLGQVYGRHPLRRRDYLPYAGFHRTILHEKSIEAARYLLSLGARDVEISCNESKGREAKADAGVKAPTLDDVSLNMGFGRSDGGKLAIRMTGGAGKRRRTPEDLIWPSHDPMFKLVYDAAQAGVQDFSFGLQVEQSSSVNAQAAVKIQNELGFGLGGEYKRWEDLNLTVEARFAQDVA